MAITFKITGDRELALYLGRASSGIKKQIYSGLDDIGEHLQKKVKEKFGTYQSGWPKLKRASVIAKYRKRALKGIKTGARKIAFTVGADDPLVLFGNLEKSIQKEVNKTAMQTIVFSDNVYAAVHEYGYKQIPARSYMRLTLSDETNEVIKILDAKIGRII